MKQIRKQTISSALVSIINGLIMLRIYAFLDHTL